jgi:Ca2+-binding RTX toxin-like protein
VVANGLLLDHEQTASHVVTVEAKDKGGLTFHKALTITVRDWAAESTAGSAASDHLIGGSGNDTFMGSAGNDTLVGGWGNDVLSGGSGSDTFIFKDRLSKTSNVDRIADYDKSQDNLQLDNKYMTKLGGSGRLSGSKFVLGSKALDGNDHLIYDRSTGKLYYDADGSGAGAQVLIAHFANKAALLYSEVTVI